MSCYNTGCLGKWWQWDRPRRAMWLWSFDAPGCPTRSKCENHQNRSQSWQNWNILKVELGRAQVFKFQTVAQRRLIISRAMTTFKTLLLSSVLFTFGYSKPFVNATSNQTSKIQWIDCASNIPDALNSNQLPSPLPSTLQCGRLDVPMDYTKPISSENKITLGFSMHRPENPLGLVNL